MSIKIAHVSTFQPLHCGIAFYAADLISALPHAKHAQGALHYGTTHYTDAEWTADVSCTSQLKDLARKISASDCDVISLQHEFGIWGGVDGEHIEAFLDNIRKPIVSTLHTTFNAGYRNARQVDILRRLVIQSARVIVLTPASKNTLAELLGIDLPKVHVIPHGVPHAEYRPPPTVQPRNQRSGVPLRLISLGFFREDKGLEEILVTLWYLKRGGWNIHYRIAGEPQAQFGGQTEYRIAIGHLVQSLGLEHSVSIDGRFLSVAEQIQAIQESHAGIFAYQDTAHASSGTFPLVLASGRPAICTPFEYGVAKDKEGPGVYVAKSSGVNGMTEAVLRFLGALSNLPSQCEEIYRRTRVWEWSNVGRLYAEQFRMATGVDCY